MTVFDYTRGFRTYPSQGYAKSLGSTGTTQQQMQMPSPSQALEGYNFYQEYFGTGDTFSIADFWGGGGQASGATGGQGSGGGGSWMSGLASNPYTWLVLALGAKAEHTRKTSDISYEDQLKNISLAPQKDFDRWGLEKYTPLGGGDVYKSTFDLATFDLSNWWEGAVKSPLREIRDLF